MKELLAKVQIKGFDHYLVSNLGFVHNTKTGRTIAGEMDKKMGYTRVTMSNKKEKYRASMHRLVATHFLPNPKNHPMVCHKDSNPQNNKVDNLRWDNGFGNMKDRRERGSAPKQEGELNYAAKLKTQQAITILKMAFIGFTEEVIATLFGISRQTVNDIKRKKSWTHIQLTAYKSISGSAHFIL